jgi:hypothetical protein
LSSRYRLGFIAVTVLAALVASRAWQETSTQLNLAGSEQASLEREEYDATGFEESLKWRLLGWQDEDGGIPKGAIMKAKQQRESMIGRNPGLNGAGITPSSWTSRGPQNVGGRTLSLVINPANPNMMWAAAASGGIWFTSDGGVNWAPVNDFLPTLNANTLVMNPLNPNEMYCGTGEANFSIATDAGHLLGAGIFKTTNATTGSGATWTQLASTASWGTVYKLAISPNGILLATSALGILRSTNGGLSWTTTYTGACFDVAFDRTQGSTRAIAGIDNGALYSTDAGSSWSQATISNAGLATTTRLAYAPGNPQVVYASSDHTTAPSAFKRKIWRSTDGGQSYGLPVTEPNQEIFTQGAYTNALWVCPTNENFILEGGIYLYRSTDGGVTFERISEQLLLSENVHPDLQFLVSQETGQSFASNPRVYACTDGGIFRTDNIFTAGGTFGWMSLNRTYQTTQFYGAAGTSNYVIGGTQDNGTLKVTSSDSNATAVLGGDGGFCAVDPTDDSYCYAEYVFLELQRFTGQGTSAPTPIHGGIINADSPNFIAPFILDPGNSGRMYAGSRRLWRSDNVRDANVTWSSVRNFHQTDASISAIAVAPASPNVVWIGDRIGHVYRTTNGGSDWTVIDNNKAYDPKRNPFPNRYITRILIDPADANLVYVSLGGFAENNLYRTTVGLAPILTGSDWQDITGGAGVGIPAVPIRSLARHPGNANWLYAGTEIGIFTTENGGTTWSTTNDGPANAPIFDLFFLPNSTTLLAATFGRGLWQAAVGGGPPVCTYSLSPTSQSFGAAGGPGSVTVTANAGCGWTATSQANWITINSGASGTGNGLVNYTVANNPLTSPRTGTITAQSQTLTVSQAAGGGSCTFSISPPGMSFGSSGGSSSVNVTTQPGCSWQANSNDQWISITAGGMGTGSGPVFYTVTANPGPARTGTITVEEQTFTVTQAAASCVLSISPASQSFTAAGGSGTITVALVSGAGCGWNAASNAAWITITSGAMGTDNGAVNYLVSANSESNRSGSITVAGQTFNVTQTGSGGGSNLSLSLPGTAHVSVAAPAGSSLDITGSLTVEAWVKTSKTTSQGLVERWNPGDGGTGLNGGYSLRILKTTNQVRFSVFTNSGVSRDVFSDSTAPLPNNGQWHHIAGVYDTTTSPFQLRVYIDGHLRGSSLISAFSVPSGNGNLTIGAAADGNQKLTGLIEDVRVTAAALYNGDFTRPYPLSPVIGTRALWHFNNDYADSAGTNNGTITGTGATFSSDVPPGGMAQSSQTAASEWSTFLASYGQSLSEPHRPKGLIGGGDGFARSHQSIGHIEPAQKAVLAASVDGHQSGKDDRQGTRDPGGVTLFICAGGALLFRLSRHRTGSPSGGSHRS